MFMRMLNIRISDRLYRKLDDHAANYQLSRPDMLRLMIGDWLRLEKVEARDEMLDTVQKTLESIAADITEPQKIKRIEKAIYMLEIIKSPYYLSEKSRKERQKRIEAEREGKGDDA